MIGRGGREPTLRAISPLTVNRLSIYLRCLEQLTDEATGTISSQGLAERFNLNSAQIRKDLAYFGEFGIRGVGYEVEMLRDQIKTILGVDRQRKIVVVGAGNLGMALAHSLIESGPFDIVAVLDKSRQRVGAPVVEGLAVEHVEKIDEIVEKRGAEIGIISVSAPAAQEVADQLIAAGLNALLNFTPAPIIVPDSVRMKSVDLKVHLEELTFGLGCM